jgi:MFS family permease
METERGYSSGQAMTTMLIAIVMLAAGGVLGGVLGDALFKRTPRGRVLVSTGGVLMGAILLLITMSVNDEKTVLFTVLLSLTSLAMPIASSNVMATVHDTTVPEARSTARSLHKLVEDGGAAMAPWLAGVVAMRSSLHTAILAICVSTWLICALIFSITALVVPQDVERLRQIMQHRAKEAKRHANQAV